MEKKKEKRKEDSELSTSDKKISFSDSFIFLQPHDLSIREFG